MSLKDLDVSDPSKLSKFELKYAFDRYLITEEEFNENGGGEADSDSEDDYDNKRKWSGKKLEGRALELSLDPSEYGDRGSLVEAIRSAEG
jgi:hypothetical protein